MSRLIIASLILTFALSSHGSAQTREVPKGWKEINMCGLSFLVPKNLKKQNNFKPIDSCIGAFKSKNLGLGFDYGMYTAPPEDASSYRGGKAETLEIDGKKARLLTYPYGARIYILVAESEYGKSALGMSITSKTQNDVETAKRIFQSIRFVKEN
jgi:hypothetical protein